MKESHINGNDGSWLVARNTRLKTQDARLILQQRKNQKLKIKKQNDKSKFKIVRPRIGTNLIDGDCGFGVLLSILGGKF